MCCYGHGFERTFLLCVAIRMGFKGAMRMVLSEVCTLRCYTQGFLGTSRLCVALRMDFKEPRFNSIDLVSFYCSSLIFESSLIVYS